MLPSLESRLQGEVPTENQWCFNCNCIFRYNYCRISAEAFKGLDEIAWFLPLDEAIASRAVYVIVSGSDGWTGGRAETLLEPAN